MTGPEPALNPFPYAYQRNSDHLKRLPGRMFVAVDFYCQYCGPRRRLARFGRNTFAGANPGEWQATWRKGGVAQHSRWVDLPDGTDAVVLFCNVCKHTPDPIPRAWIIALIDNVKPNDDGYGVDHVPV